MSENRGRGQSSEKRKDQQYQHRGRGGRGQQQQQQSRGRGQQQHQQSSRERGNQQQTTADFHTSSSTSTVQPSSTTSAPSSFHGWNSSLSSILPISSLPSTSTLSSIFEPTFSQLQREENDLRLAKKLSLQEQSTISSTTTTQLMSQEVKTEEFKQIKQAKEGKKTLSEELKQMEYNQQKDFSTISTGAASKRIQVKPFKSIINNQQYFVSTIPYNTVQSILL